MSEVYIVIENSNNAAPDVCEVYSDKQQAFGRAGALGHFAAVHHPLWDTTPKEKVDAHGNQYWVFLSQSGFNRHYVAVYYKKVEEKDVLKPVTFSSPLPPPVVLYDNPHDPFLPAGWSYSGKPLTMSDLLDDPYNVVPFNSLTEPQQLALVTSRIKKRPNFFQPIIGVGNFNQQAALQELENKTNFGLEIIMMEIIWLDRVLNELKEVEESSSESSEDY